MPNIIRALLLGEEKEMPPKTKTIRQSEIEEEEEEEEKKNDDDDEAGAVIQAKMQNLGLSFEQPVGEMNIEMQIPNNKVELIDGVGEAAIRYLRSKSHASVEWRPYPVMERKVPDTTTLRITGNKKQIEEAKDMIKDAIDQMRPAHLLSGHSTSFDCPSSSNVGGACKGISKRPNYQGGSSCEQSDGGMYIEMQIPNNKVELIDGVGEAAIKYLRKKSHASIEWRPYPLMECEVPDTTTLRITGNKKQIKDAKDMIKDAIHQMRPAHLVRGHSTSSDCPSSSNVGGACKRIYKRPSYQGNEDTNPFVTTISNGPSLDGQVRPTWRLFSEIIGRFDELFRKHSWYKESYFIIDDFMPSRLIGFGFHVGDCPEVDKEFAESHCLNEKQVSVDRTISVSMLPVTMGKDDVMGFFSKYGKILESEIVSRTGSDYSLALLIFEKKESVDGVFRDSNLYLHNTKVKVRRAHSLRSFLPPPGMVCFGD